MSEPLDYSKSEPPLVTLAGSAIEQSETPSIASRAFRSAYFGFGATAMIRPKSRSTAALRDLWLNWRLRDRLP